MDKTKKSTKNKRDVKVEKKGTDVKIPADINIGESDREPTAIETQRTLNAMAGGTAGEPTAPLRIERPTIESVPTEPSTGQLPTDQIQTIEDPNETNLETPAEVRETQKLAGIFRTEPKPVTEAIPHEDPSVAKKVLGWGTGWIPGVGSGTGSLYWYSAIYPYVKNPKTFMCPSSLNEHPNRSSFGEEIGYGYNYYNRIECYQWPWQKMGRIRLPSETLIICDSYGDETSSPPGRWAYAVAPWTTRQLSDRHNEGANVLFFDGHVSWYKKGWLSGQATVNNSIWNREK